MLRKPPMKARTKNFELNYTAADGGLKDIPLYSPDANKLFVGSVSVNLRKAASTDVVSSLSLVIVNAVSGDYTLLNRSVASDFKSQEINDMLSADGARYTVSNVILNASDQLKVVLDTTPTDAVDLGIRVSGFESTDR
jgi:hypothetical protein